MKLPKSFLSKKEKSEYLLALLLRSEKISAIILQETDGKIQVIGQHEEYLSSNLEETPIETMLEVLDRTLSRAESVLPADVEVEKTLFGVKENWIEDKKIKKEYLAKLKKVSDELHLKPIGFLIISEAIAHLIQEEEGAPLSAIIAEIGRAAATLTLFRGGRAIESKSAPIEGSVAKSVDSLLKHFTSVEVLPSRVIVFNGERDEELAQEFISHSWSRSLPFLHMPQVSVLPAGFDGRSVVYGAAMQMGFEVLGSLSGGATDDIKVLPAHPVGKHDKEEVHEEMGTEETSTDEKGHPDVLKKDHEAIVPAMATEGDNFGFVMEQDVASGETITPPGDHPQKHAHSKHHVDDIEEPETAHESKSAPVHHEPLTAVDESFEDPPQRNRTDRRTKSGLQIAGILAPLTGFLTRLPIKSVALPTLGGLRNGSKLLFIPPLILILLIACVLWYMFRLQATVVLNVQPKIQEESENISFSVTSPNDFSDNIIQAKSISTTVEGSASTNATGKKEIGEKAKGTVTLFNSTESKKQLSAGTTITSGNNLEFTLDKDVTIGSASGDIFSGIKSGTAKVDVTAKTIGSESNLPSNTKFTVSGNANVAAKNDSAFSGGSKKDVTVVAKKDIEKLTKELPDTLEEKAKADAKSKISSGETMLPGFISTTLTKRTLSAEEGKEAKTLTLKANVTFEAVSYQDKDLKDYAETLVKNKVTQDSALADNGLTFDVSDIQEVDEEKITAKLNIKAGLLPKIDKESTLTKITGKSFTDAEGTLKQLPQVSKLDIRFTPNIPFLPKYLPRTRENITLVINANE